MANVLDRNFDFATNGTVTAAGLHNLIDETNIYAGLISTQEEKTTVGTADLLLIADSSSIGSPQIAANRTTVYNLFDDALSVGTYTGLNLTGALTYGTATGTRLVSANATITTGTITTLNSTTGTIATLNSTTGTIPTLVATTLITTGTGTAAAPAIVPTGDTNTGIFFPAADTIAFAEGGAEAMRIDSSGNVGIGTASPIRKLSVEGGGIGFQDAGGSASRAISWIDSTTSNSPLQILGNSTTGNCFLSFLTNAFGSAATERLRIDSSGRVGIGTTSPLKELQINATEPTIRLEESSGGSKRLELSINSSSEAKIFANQSGGTLILGTVGTERLRIDSSGNVLVGTTSTDFSSGVGFKFLASATMPKLGIVINSSGADSQYNFYNTNATNNGYRFYVNNNGGISNFSANNVNLSDERLKTNINLCGNYLDKICSIPVKTFNYKDQGEDTEKTIGVLAQEVEAHIPELINNDGFGETPADGIPLKTIYQTDLQYVLMRCIQEQQAMIQELSAKVTALEAA